MRIHIYTIHKNKSVELQLQHYIKACKGFGVEIYFYNLFNKQIQYAQKRDLEAAKQSYSNAFLQYLDTRSILLDCGGILYNSLQFSQMIEDSIQNSLLKFFIAGAFGFEEKLLQKYRKISLSTLTFSHELVQFILLEQIYRALSIIKNHPYHKM